MNSFGNVRFDGVSDAQPEKLAQERVRKRLNEKAASNDKNSEYITDPEGDEPDD